MRCRCQELGPRERPGTPEEIALFERQQAIPKDNAFWQAVHEYNFGLPKTVPTEDEWYEAHGIPAHAPELTAEERQEALAQWDIMYRQKCNARDAKAIRDAVRNGTAVEDGRRVVRSG